MGKLIWDNKTNITENIAPLKTKYKDFFKKVALDNLSAEVQTLTGTTHH